MQYSKSMVELVYEIRRRVPTELKPAVKLANPELLEELLQHYYGDATTIAKALIKELLSLAGEPWNDILRRQATTAPNERQVVKIYRGQTRLEPVKVQQESEHNPQIGQRPKKIYRGQVVR